MGARNGAENVALCEAVGVITNAPNDGGRRRVNE